MAGTDGGGAARGILGALALVLAAVGVYGVMAGLLFGVPPTDVLTYGVTLAVLLGAALVATLIPAWRATAVDPSMGLRFER